MLFLQLAIFLFFGIQPTIPSPTKLDTNHIVLAAHTQVKKLPTPASNAASPTPTPKLVQTKAQVTYSTPVSVAPVVPTVTEKLQFIMQGINTYRHEHGLGKVVTSQVTCDFANVRAGEVAMKFDHSGFDTRIQNHTLPYGHYSYVTENIAETGNYEDVVNLWINSPSHAANMRADTPYVCVGISGNFYAYEGFKP